VVLVPDRATGALSASLPGRVEAYHALIRGILTVERRIAPLWMVAGSSMAQPQRQLRERVTANCFRELDVLLDHWTGSEGSCVSEALDRLPVHPSRPLPRDIVALAAAYWAAAHAMDAVHGCHLLT
jgi:hypothetical protein